MSQHFVVVLLGVHEYQNVIINTDGVWFMLHYFANLFVEYLCCTVDPKVQVLEPFETSVCVECCDFVTLFCQFQLHVSSVHIEMRKVFDIVELYLQLSKCWDGMSGLRDVLV